MKFINLVRIKAHEFRYSHPDCWNRLYLYTFPVDWNIHSKYGGLLNSAKEEIEFKALHLDLMVPL